jgi:hypothetical protein
MLSIAAIFTCSMRIDNPSRASASTAPASQSSAAGQQIFHHLGAYQLFNTRELHGLLSSGMNLVLDPPYLIRRLEAADHHSRVRYIDNLLPLIYWNIATLEPMNNPGSCLNRALGCVVSPSDYARIHEAISAELLRARADPRTVDFYIQDDPIGSTRVSIKPSIGGSQKRGPVSRRYADSKDGLMRHRIGIG